LSAPPDREPSRFAAARYAQAQPKRLSALLALGHAANRDGSRSVSSRPAPAGWPACKRHRQTRKRRLPTGKARWQTCKRRRQPCWCRWQAWKPRLPTRKRRLQVRKPPKDGPFPLKTPVLAVFGPSSPPGREIRRNPPPTATSRSGVSSRAPPTSEPQPHAGFPNQTKELSQSLTPACGDAKSPQMSTAESISPASAQRQ